jgi:hypothetical protein
MKRDITVIGIDIAKRVCHVSGMDKRGKILLRKRLYGFHSSTIHLRVVGRSGLPARSTQSPSTI